MEKRKVFVLSGLGADERVFQLLDLDNVELVHIQWIAPLSSKETMSSYAKRLLPQITELYPILIGLSFGGMMAVELSRHIAVKKAIIISSVKGREEFPQILGPLGRLGVFKAIPLSVISKMSRMNHFIFGAKTALQKQLLDSTIKETDPHFYRWAMARIIRLRKMPRRKNLVHIHGSKDNILPIKFVKPDHVIEGGGHLMVMDKAKEISKIINEEIAKA